MDDKTARARARIVRLARGRSLFATETFFPLPLPPLPSNDELAAAICRNDRTKDGPVCIKSTVAKSIVTCRFNGKVLIGFSDNFAII